MRRLRHLLPVPAIGIVGSFVSCTSFGPKGNAVPNPPATTHEAQSAIYGHYQRTLQELPEGFVLDQARYGDGRATACDDNAADPAHAPATYNDVREVAAPAGTDHGALIARVGEIWQKWGWRVAERDDFNKPNRFGYAPDGYWLSIESAPEGFPGHPPTFTGGSPCFPGDGSRYAAIPSPKTITRDGPQA